MAGWIKLHRELLNWEWYDDSNVVRVFLHCLLRANHESKEWRGSVVERGSFITSISNMAKEINLSEKQIRLALNKLKRTSEVASKGTTQHTVIQVVKYDQYQQEGEQQGKRGANEGQTRGEQRATNKNVKNDKNDKKDRPDSLEAVISYMRERGFSNPVVTGHKWYDYYTANGWKVGRNPMKDWRASVRTWEKEHKGSTTNTPTYKKLG